MLAFFIAFIPHFSYAYPVHLDEWQVMAFSDQLFQQGGTTGLTDPIRGGTANTNQLGEIGTHVFWGTFREITGMDWLPIFRLLPGLIFMVTVLSVFVLARRLGFGWQAAFFVSLLPTLVGILGPGFLAPVSLAIVFVPMALFLAFYRPGFWAYPVLSLLALGTAVIHPPTAATLLVVIFPYVLLELKGNARVSLGIALALVLPFAILLPAIHQTVIPVVKWFLTLQPVGEGVALPSLVSTLGYVTVGLFLLGVARISWKGSRASNGLVLGTVALLVMLAVFFILRYGVRIVYYRGLVVGMLMVSVLAGAGLAAAGKLRLPAGLERRLKAPWLAHRAGALAVLALVMVTLAIVIPMRVSTPYYHMIDSEDYAAFTWIRNNLDVRYDRALLDPWKSMPFVAVAGKTVFSITGEEPDWNGKAVYAFLEGGATDTALLTGSGISVVYTRDRCDNPDLVEVRKYVYVLAAGDQEHP